jgi:hypothetical protein
MVKRVGKEVVLVVEDEAKQDKVRKGERERSGLGICRD